MQELTGILNTVQAVRFVSIQSRIAVTCENRMLLVEEELLLNSFHYIFFFFSFFHFHCIMHDQTTAVITSYYLKTVESQVFTPYQYC